MKYIIMCGGTYTRFEKPKQLTEINGESLVARTIRLLRENGVEDIAISSNNEVFEQFGVPVLHHDNPYVFRSGDKEVEGYWMDCFYPTDEPVCYVFGDVYFSPEAIRKIVSTPTDSVMLFGSKQPFASDYPKHYREPFAYKVQDQKRFRAAIQRTKELHKQHAFSRHPIAWELWKVIRGTPLSKGPKGYKVINDYTCDIDAPEDRNDYSNNTI